MGRSIMAISIGITVLLAGCGNQVHHATDQNITTPPTPSTITKVTQDPAAPTCIATQLSATDSGNQGGGTQIQTYIKITNISGSACVLLGVPTALDLLGGGTTLWTKTLSDPSNLEERAQLLSPHTANAAYLVVWWGNWCGAANERVDLRITLPDSRGTLLSSFNSYGGGHEFVPECLQQREPSTLQVTAAYLSQ